jgi:hypothetical protein
MFGSDDNHYALKKPFRKIRDLECIAHSRTSLRREEYQQMQLLAARHSFNNTLRQSNGGSAVPLR